MADSSYVAVPSGSVLQPVSFAMKRLFSYESVRKSYRKIGENLPRPDKIRRHVIAADETKLKISGHQVFVWSAIDVKRYEGTCIESNCRKDGA